MNIGKAIKLVRTKRKLTQTELAKRAGVSGVLISQLERSKSNPTIQIIGKIAVALEIPIELLFFLGSEESELAYMNSEIVALLTLGLLEILSADEESKIKKEVENLNTALKVYEPRD